MILSAVAWPLAVVTSVVVIASTALITISLRGALPTQRPAILRAWAQIARALRGGRG